MNPNKTFDDLKMRQREDISEWLFLETYRFYKLKSRMPNKSERNTILDNVYNKIRESGVWIPYNEVRKYYLSRLIHFEKRILRHITKQ